MTETKKFPVLHVVCAVLLDERDHVLVARRPLDKSLGGLWEFPGGKVEDGESLADAMVREISEELGAMIKVCDDGVGVIGHFDHQSDGVVIRLHPVICYLAEDSPPPEALEHLELRWLSVTEETEIDWALGDRRIFAALKLWYEKSSPRRSGPTGNLFRVLFWMTFLGYAMLYAGNTYDKGIVASLGLLLFFPALPLGVLVESFVGVFWNPIPTLNWLHNFGNHAMVVLFLAINAWLLTRIWRQISK